MNKRILFIKDYAAASIIPDVIFQAGYNVDIAIKSEIALRGLDAVNYNLVILAESPDVESWIDCENIRKSTTLPLIVISHSASPEACVKAINAGADFFIRKPFGPLELLARINSLVQRTTSRLPVSALS
ncbi:MAG: response regulator transcription factor [Dehalococcoidales bacterium]